MAIVREVKGDVLHAARGKGFMRLAGRSRYQYMEGGHYVVGGGKAVQYDTDRECFAHVERVQREAKERAAAKRASQGAANRAADVAHEAAAPVAVGGIAVGARVEFEIRPGLRGCGVVGEIGARSVAIDTDDGARYRRAASDCKRVA